MPNISTDQSRKLTWYVRKGQGKSIFINCTSGGSAYDISSLSFTVPVKRFGNGCFSPENHPYGLCRLIFDKNQTYYPITADKEKVFPNDQYDVAWYHRLLNANPEESEEYSFGRKSSVDVNQSVRTVFISEIELGEDIVLDFINAIPDKLEFSGYKFIEVSKDISLNRDSGQVWTDEWDNSYRDKYQMRYHIYAIEWTLNYIKCSNC